jgi:hypothetical protein
MDASLKRSHSRASSVHSLIYQSPVNKPTSKSLAGQSFLSCAPNSIMFYTDPNLVDFAVEEALRLHLSKDQVLSGDTSVAPFQALVGGPGNQSLFNFHDFVVVFYKLLILDSVAQQMLCPPRK